MKLAKSLLLGSAAGLIAVAGAQAADLPTRKAAPVEYVRICAVHGPGFFYIPGTDTCIKIGGRAGFDIECDEQRTHSAATVGIECAGPCQLRRPHLDRLGSCCAPSCRVDIRRAHRALFPVRAPTCARASASVTAAASTRGRLPELQRPGLLLGDRRHPARVRSTSTSAFIQWGGLTAGRFQSFFDFYADNDNCHGMGDSDVATKALAYTYTFGNGFSATLAIEDGSERRNVVASVGTVASGQYLPERLRGRGLQELRHHFPGDRQPDLRFASGLPGRLQLLRHRAASDLRLTSSAPCASIKVGARLSCPAPGTVWACKVPSSTARSLGAANSGAGTVAGGFGGLNGERLGRPGRREDQPADDRARRRHLVPGCLR